MPGSDLFHSFCQHARVCLCCNLICECAGASDQLCPNKQINSESNMEKRKYTYGRVNSALNMDKEMNGEEGYLSKGTHQRLFKPTRPSSPQLNLRRLSLFPSFFPSLHSLPPLPRSCRTRRRNYSQTFRILQTEKDEQKKESLYSLLTFSLKGRLARSG